MIYLYSCLLWINTIADTMNVCLVAAGHIRRRSYLKSSLIGRVTRLFVHVHLHPMRVARDSASPQQHTHVRIYSSQHGMCVLLTLFQLTLPPNARSPLPSIACCTTVSYQDDSHPMI